MKPGAEVTITPRQVEEVLGLVAGRPVMFSVRGASVEYVSKFSKRVVIEVTTVFGRAGEPLARELGIRMRQPGDSFVPLKRRGRA